MLSKPHSQQGRPREVRIAAQGVRRLALNLGF
jgi:hypothetical protein